MIEIPTWYIPSFWGDIRLEHIDDASCRLVAEKLTEGEKMALAAASVHGEKKGWTTGALGEGTHVVGAPIAKVSKVIAKALKPKSKIVSAVVFSDGTMQEHREETALVKAEDEATPEVLPKATAKRGRKPKAATSVAAPVRGCPPPDFDAAEIRAQRVLEAFLLPTQIEDFRRYNRFVSIGHSGRRYMVTSRHARDSLAMYHRSLYDLEDQTPLCVHDWDVPAPEEMLAIHVLLGLPGWELYLRKVEGEDEETNLSLMPRPLDFVVRDPYGRDMH